MLLSIEYGRRGAEGMREGAPRGVGLGSRRRGGGNARA